MAHIHSNDQLYPRSVYLCSACGTLHRTRPMNGAVNWQCQNELIGGPDYHQPAKQEYVGYECSCGEVVDLRKATSHAGVGFILPALEREVLR
jgi:hypothetical protein